MCTISSANWPLEVFLLFFVIFFIVQLNTQAIHNTIININYARARQKKSHNIVPWASNNSCWQSVVLSLHGHFFQYHHNRYPWLIRQGDTWGILCELKIWLMYFVTRGSSQPTPHVSSVRAIHGVTSVNSTSDWCITSLHGHHNRHPMARPERRYMGCPLWVQSWINVLHHYRILTTDIQWLTRKGDTWCDPKIGIML